MSGVLVDKEIKKLIKEGQLIAYGFRENQLTPNGVDLSIGGIVEKLGEKAFSVITDEYLKIPNDIIAQIFLKSRYSRKGVWGTFGLVDAGFEGKLQFTIFGLDEEQMNELVRINAPIVQIMFIGLGGDVERNYAKRSGNFQFFTLDKNQGESK